MSTDDKKDSTTPVMEVLEEDDEFEVRELACQDNMNTLYMLKEYCVMIRHRHIEEVFGRSPSSVPCLSGTSCVPSEWIAYVVHGTHCYLGVYKPTSHPLGVFQEFADPDWDASAADPHDEQQWQDDWDDDKTDDDFSKQLRAELEKQQAKQPSG